MQAMRSSLRRCFTHWETLQSCCPNAVRHMSVQAIPIPAIDNLPKTYPPKIEKIVSDISTLTLIEVSELSELLKKRLNLPDAPLMPVGGFVPAGAVAGSGSEEKQEESVKNTFSVKLMKYDEKQKVALIKCIKTVVEGMNLVQAKKFVESVPVVVKPDCNKEDAEKLKKELNAVGAEVILE